jgi:hypothetical protein
LKNDGTDKGVDGTGTGGASASEVESAVVTTLMFLITTIKIIRVTGTIRLIGVIRVG